ncbi:MAG: undecaprenyl-diphosphate phosphatase [Candidatus Omnitrophota bacterium]|nr:undecaprenyl-diphosphate phosphatase [Candidatus Omnitrophota bacterium]
MTMIQAIISGIVQGVTEFFPMSSSGHLVLLHSVFGFRQSMLTFDVFLHFGTILSVLIFFRKEIVNMLRKDKALLKFIIVGSIPTFIIGLLFKDVVENYFSMPRTVGLFLVITGIFLLLASLSAIYRKIIRRNRPLGYLNSIIIGFAQGISILPGISRSGSTIGAALMAGLGESDAVKFSFLLSVPAVLGANILKARQICGNLVSTDTVAFIAGGIAAMVTGFFAIKVLLVILNKNLFFLFGIYCMLMGAAVMILSK